ncbi:DUF6777 domain-containing protein [Streptomyces sp. NPDC003362]
MSVEPPNSGRPTGPPSGPLSGRAQPPSGPPPPPPPPGPGPAPDHEPREPGRPWWKSVPRVATIAVVVAALATVGVLLTRGDSGTGGSREVFLQAANSRGPDPFTDSTAQGTSTSPATPTTPPTTALTPSETVTTGENRVRGYNGGTPGVYGGTRDVAACDVELQITYLRENPDRNRAFAAALKLDPDDVPAYLRGLTPVLLRMDTRVTNHGYRDGEADPYQAILQSGTAVLVNDRGLPRVRCACGNPLTNPLQQHTGYERIGDSWPSFDPAKVIVILPAAEPVKTFVLRDIENGGWVARARGDDGDRDVPTEPPKIPPTPTDISPRPPSPDTGSPTSEKPSSESSPRPDSSPTPPPPSPPTSPDTSTPEPPTQSPPASTSVPDVPDSITQSTPPTSLPVPGTSVPSV